MKQFLYIVGLCLLLFSCNQISKSDILLEDFIPDNSAVVIKSKSFETLASDIKNNEIISKLTSQDLFSKLQENISKFENLNLEEEVIICISDKNDLTFLSKYGESLYQIDSLPKAEGIYYKILTGNYLVASTSQKIIGNDLRANANTELSKLLNLGLNNNSFSLIFNTTESTRLLDSVFKSDRISINKLATLVTLNVRMEQDKIEFNGVSRSTDSLPKIISVFENTIPKKNKSPQFTPDSFESMLSVTFDDFKTFNQNMKRYNKTSSIDSTNLQLFDVVHEIGVITNKNDFAIILVSDDIIDTKESLLAEQEVLSSFRQTEIFNFSNKGFFKLVLNPFVDKDVSKYIIVNNAVIFSSSEAFLKDR